MTWVHRLRRVREWASGGLPGVGATRVRVLRTSNGYAFNDPSKPSEFELRSGTEDQGFFSPMSAAVSVVENPLCRLLAMGRRG